MQRRLGDLDKVFCVGTANSLRTIPTARSLNLAPASHGARILNGTFRNPMPHLMTTRDGSALQDASIARPCLTCSPNAGEVV